MNITLKIPKYEAGLSNFTISQISYGYKKYGGEYFGVPGSSASCNINVVCSQGNDWQNERNAVVFLLVADGTGTCTGSMIMNTCNTNTPYLLTANHCLGGDLNNWVFQYQYWSTTCTSNTGGREDIQFNGCTLRANATTDFALIEMNQTPPANSGIMYAGWDRSSTLASNTVQIHHPASDLMKISFDANSPIAVSWPGVPGLTHWRVHFQQGTVQPGSSGAPLFDQNHRIIGQCHGDQNNIGDYCGQQISENGRFDLSWTGGGTNSTRLSNWLDPENTGAATTNTTNISNLISINANDYQIIGDDDFCTISNTYSIPNLPPDAIVNWSTFPSDIVFIGSPNSTATTLTKSRDGVFTLTATISNFCGDADASIKIHKSIIAGPPPAEMVGPYHPQHHTTMGVMCTEMPYYFIVFDIDPGSSYTWKLTAPPEYTTIFPKLYAGSPAYMSADSAGLWTLELSRSNSCGTTITRKYVDVQECFNSFTFNAFPNPAKGNVTISIDQNNLKSKSTLNGNVLIDLYNFNTAASQKKWTFTGLQKQYDLNMAQVPKGIYILRVSVAGKQQSIKLVVE